MYDPIFEPYETLNEICAAERCEAEEEGGTSSPAEPASPLCLSEPSNLRGMRVKSEPLLTLYELPLSLKMQVSHSQACGDMSQVLPTLMLGSAYNASDLASLKNNNIRIVINVASEKIANYDLQSGVDALYHLPVSYTTRKGCQMEKFFQLSLLLEECLEEVRESNGRVLVHCMRGHSRSVAVVMCYLIYKGVAFDSSTALKYIKLRRPIAGPIHQLVEQVDNFARQLQL